jgi:hypothetical protein
LWPSQGGDRGTLSRLGLDPALGVSHRTDSNPNKTAFVSHPQVSLGYTHVYWSRGAGEAWEVAGLPENTLDMQEW